MKIVDQSVSHVWGKNRATFLANRLKLVPFGCLLEEILCCMLVTCCVVGFVTDNPKAAMVYPN